MERQIFATIKMDMESIDKKLQAVIDAHLALRNAIRDLEEAAYKAEQVTIK